MQIPATASRGSTGAELPVELGVPSTLRRDHCVVEIRSEATVELGRCGAVLRVVGRYPGSELLLLRVEPPLGVRGSRAEDAEPVPSLRDEAAHPEMRANARLMDEGDERVVVVDAVVAPGQQLAVCLGLDDRTEELDRLVDEVRAEVVRHAAALRTGRLGLPQWLRS